MKYRNSILIFFILSLISLFFGCSNKTLDEECFYLDGFWEYKTSDMKYKTIDVSDLQNLSKFVDNEKGYINLKYVFDIPQKFDNKQLGIFLGSIQLAGTVYVNNNYLGKNGRFPEHNFSGGTYSSFYMIPSDYINNNGKNTLEVVVWVDGKGSFSDTPCIGLEEYITSKANHSIFFNSRLFLIIAFILFMFGNIYFILFVLRPNNSSYFSFSGLCWMSWLYIANFYYAEIPILYRMDYLYFQKIFNGIVPILTAYFDISFVRDYLSYKDSKARKIYRFIIVLIPLILICLPKNMNGFYLFQKIAFGFVGIQMIYSFKLMFRSIKEKNKQIIIIFIGFSPVLLSILIDIGLSLYTKQNYIILITFGWLTTILFFFDYLLYTLVQTSKKFEYMTNNLEEIVKQRTDELTDLNTTLSETNSKLSFEKERSEKEIQLAAYVQQSYFNHNLKQLDDWEISYYFNPLEGVSGDMYDFYYDSNKLHGLGLFDISGHGIAAGLVSMLVKNIIQQEFYLDLTSDLASVMTLINDRIINEKGNIENYLTGILIRLNDNNIELVNAGHPEPILYNAKDNHVSFVQKQNETQCGVIGLPYVPTNFFNINFSVNTGDAILLYTDGITESKNEDGIEFGKERLMESFKNNSIKPVSEQIEGIFEDFFAYIKNEPIKDDLTLIILKRK